MKKPLHWRAQARLDVEAAATWYASQGGLALELAFTDELESAAGLLARHPGSGSARHAALFQELPAPLRFIALKRFNRYLIYYLELPEHVDVLRVWDASRGLEGLAQSIDD